MYHMYTEVHPGGAAYTTFMRMRRAYLDFIKIRKCKRFAACKYCVQLKELIGKHTGTTKVFWKAELKLHNAWQMRERQKCARQVEKATNPTSKHKHMVMMIDNMDHSKTDLPHFPREPHDLEHGAKLVTHMTGVHVPGWKRRPLMCFTWHDLFPTGSDSIITIILLVCVNA